ncbi:MAG: sensor histidine kinase [Cyclobacteriaceae bacterium]
MKKLVLILFTLFILWDARGQSSLKTDSTDLWKKIITLENRIWADFPKTFKEAQSVLDEARNSDCYGCEGRAFMMVGKFYWVNGQYNQGLQHFHQSVTIAKSINDHDTWSKSTDLIANTYYYQAYYDSAEYYFQNAYQIAEKVNDLEGMILILHNTSLMYHRKGDFKKTIEYIFKGEEIQDKLPQNERHIESFGAMGSLMIDSIYYREAINDELKNLNHYVSIKDSMSIYNAYYNIAKSYRQLLDHKKAARYFVKVCVIMEKMGLIPEWNMVAKDYSDANMKDSAFYYHYQSKRDIKKATSPNAAYSLELLGESHLHFNQLDSALYYYTMALNMSYVMNNRLTFTGIHRRLVRVHTLLGNYEMAEHHLDTGLELAKEIALIHEKNLLNEGKFLYETKGDYKKALFYSEKFKDYLDSINRQEVAVNLTRLQVEFKTAKKESELKEVTQNYLLTEEKIKIRNLQMGLSLISLVLFGSFGGFYFTRFREKKKISETLEKQNNEKEALLHEIHHRVKNNLQIISSLINIKSRSANEETIELLNDLNNRIYSLGLIHEMLYKSDHLGAVDLKAYLTEQSRLTLTSLELKRDTIDLQMDLDEIETNFDVAIALGLISNELITNAIKYAFPTAQQKKIICLTLRKTIDRLHFIISDNGCSGTNPEIKKSFGLKFVEQLVKSKLKGEMNITYKNGLKVEMVLRPKL